MEEINSRNEAENRQIGEKRKKIFLLAALFVLKFFIFPWLQNKIMDYCLKDGADNKKISKKPDSRGFTLVEIMIAVAITGILAGLSVIAFSHYQPDLQLSGAARDMVSNLRYAQQLAISQQVNCGVRFYPDEKKYQIIRYSDPEEIVKNIPLPYEINFSQTGFTNNQLRFNIYGAAVEAGTITMENMENNTSTIEVKPSGFVKMQN